MKKQNGPWRIEKWNQDGRTVISIRNDEKTLAIMSAQLDNSEEAVAQAIIRAVKAA